LKTFPAPTPEKLYGGVKSIRWSDHLSADSTLAVECVSSYSAISHSHFAALKTKDAICDQLMSIHGARPSVDVKSPDVRVHVYLHEDVATVSIDLSGESLHKRGYREEGVEAPLKENLAAAILMAAGWPEALEEGRKTGKMPIFLDPMCGSGTLVIEAAQMASRRAPGLQRQKFGFHGWKQHQKGIWDSLVKEARLNEVSDPSQLPRLYGYDRDAKAVRTASTNFGRAVLRGYDGLVRFVTRDAFQLECPVADSQGLLVVNPPYGERLGETLELKPLYKALGDAMKTHFSGWQGYVFTSNPDLAKSVGLRASKRIPLFNGALECRLLKFDLYRGTKKGAPLS
jgi:23S rRNA (guanine2445-N2)-methyltransferase / 23S rRNA (guanine2069-N7)-methyltransferase